MFYPGRSGGNTPYGGIPSTKLFTVTGYTGGDVRYDYAIVILSQDVGNQAGWMAFCAG
mgnify:CR=1 FL=1